MRNLQKHSIICVMSVSPNTLNGSPTKIEGERGEPLLTVSPDGRSAIITYRWLADGERETLLHINVGQRSSDDQRYLGASLNLDSTDISGQGPALWQFATSALQDLSNRTGRTIVHVDNYNDYSGYLPATDGRYSQSQAGDYYAVYSPQDAPE